MKSNWLNRYIVFLFLAGAVIFSACKKFVDIDPPKNIIVTETAFSDSATATAAALGIYNQIMGRGGLYNFRIGDGGVTIYTGLSSDELYPTKNKTDELEFYTNSVSAKNNLTNSGNLWQAAYNLIYDANACLEGVSASASLSPSLVNQLKGEMLFIRAFIYFNLVTLYGDVPFVTSTDFEINGTLPRASKDSVYEKIAADLGSAEGLLQETYPTNGRVRPNKYTATALLARVRLYQGKWAEAESAATSVINSGLYQLEPDLNNVFLATSQEAIYQILPVYKGWETTEGVVLITGNRPTSLPAYVMTDNLLGAFETGDLRRNTWVDSNTVNGNFYYWPYKYHLGYDKNTEPVEPYMIFRLAETYLIRSEARAWQNNLAGAAEDLNTIRARSLLPETTAVEKQELLDAILHERRIELFCEWGHRWYDLKRTGTADAVLSGLKQDWQSTDILYPIPFNEIMTNPKLTQNAGY